MPAPKMCRSWNYAVILALVAPAASGTGARAAEGRAATVEEAARVLDLSALPLVPGAESPPPRRLAGFTYEAKAGVADAFAFIKKELAARGCAEQPGGYASPEASSATFAKQGFHVSVAVFPASKPGFVTINLANHGNVDLKALAPPAGGKVLYANPAGASFVTDAPVARAAEDARKALVAAGWHPYGTAIGSEYFKQNAVRVGVRTAEAPAQGNKTVVNFSSELMSVDLPVPDDSARVDYADTTKAVSFDVTSAPKAVADSLRALLGKAGWKATTDSAIKEDGPRGDQALIFRNPAQELLQLTMYPVEGMTRATLSYKSAAEVEEFNRRADAAIAKNRAEQSPAAKPVVTIAVPAGAKSIEASDARVAFQVAPGQARKAVQGLIDGLKQQGWAADVAALESIAGAASLRKGGGSLTIDYQDTGFTPAQVGLSAIGVSLKPSRAK